MQVAQATPPPRPPLANLRAPAAEEPEFTVLGPEGDDAQGDDTTPLLRTMIPLFHPMRSFTGDLGGNQQEERADPYKRIFDMLNKQMPEGKSTEGYIDDAMKL